MQDEQTQMIRKYHKMEREGELRKLSSDGSMPILSLESWWGKGPKGGGTEYYLYADGKFVKRELNTFVKDEKYGEKDLVHIERESDMYKLNLEKDEVEKIVKFLNENVTESREGGLIMDMGVSITFIRDGLEIHIINDKELYSKIYDLFPSEITS